jgi:hypothetical protein
MRGIAPIAALVNIRVRLAHRPRWSVPNGAGLNKSTLPVVSSGHLGCRALDMS